MVWSGAHIGQNRNAFDFRVTTINNTDYLTFIYGRRDPPIEPYPKGAGIIADTSFEVQTSVNTTKEIEEFNFHEFNVIDNGKSALMVMYKNQMTNITTLGLKNKTGWVGDSRIQEVDLATGDIKFEWHSLDHIALTESYDLRHVEGGFASGFQWDYV